jgi:hypothetical protein
MQDRHIQILTLHPPLEEAAPIQYSVEPHSLSPSSSYEALPYTWGDPKDIYPVLININGWATRVGTNLEAALRVLRFAKHLEFFGLLLSC